MGLLITAKRGGFRRAGVAHSADATYWPDGHFTEQQLEQLRREPQLLVIEGVQPPEELAVELEPKKDSGDENSNSAGNASGAASAPQGPALGTAASAVAPATAKPVKPAKAAGKPKANKPAAGAKATAKPAEPAKEEPASSSDDSGEDAAHGEGDGGSAE